MRRMVSLVVMLAILALNAMAGGILTNQNQSAGYIRLLARNASLDADAVYFNPAGLVKLADGWHLALHNQVISQDKTIVNSFPLLRDPNYPGEVRVPIFPDFYAVYKKNKLAVSFGFGPNAGGGSAEFVRGLPSFEIPFSTLPVLLTGMGVPTTSYTIDIAFKGKSVFLGYQLNFSYALSEAVALGVGARMIQATNTYQGHIKDVRINPGGNWVSAYTFFMSIGQPGYAAMVADKEVDAKQTGSGFTPILSLSLTPTEALVFTLKYEFNTKLELTNKTTVDDVGMFPDGYKFRNDLPAILSAGLRYAIIPKLRAHASYNYYFDKKANWEGAEQLVEKNTYELAFGLEYDLNQRMTVSAGYLRTQFGLSPQYQDDINHELTADSVGGGFKINLNEKLSLDVGTLYVFYKNYQKTETYGSFPPYNVTYKRKTLDFAVGLNYRF